MIAWIMVGVVLNVSLVLHGAGRVVGRCYGS